MSISITNEGAESFEDIDDGICELSSRSANGVDVALLWRRWDDAAIVVLVDHRNDESFVLDVHENDRPLDMFHHPYAYAAQRRVEEFRVAA